mgnify:CR=1 FL=1
MANKVYSNNPQVTYSPAYDYDDTFAGKKTTKKPSVEDYPNNVPKFETELNIDSAKKTPPIATP